MGDTVFLLGAATAAHQVEGNNLNSDFWSMEQMENSSFKEPSLDAVDHYNRFKEDIDLLENAGLNSYRFTIEWARIEPSKGHFDQKEVNHYREVLNYCHQKNVTPIVTLHHFSSPKWVIENGGWEESSTSLAFANYCEYIVSELGDLMTYICTINEANMGLQLDDMTKERIARNMGEVQVGVNFIDYETRQQEMATSYLKIFGTETPHHFLSPRTQKGNQIILNAHKEATARIKKINPNLQVGLTLSIHDSQFLPGAEDFAKDKWRREFSDYIPFIENDDFIGVQNYSRKVFALTSSEIQKLPLTQMGYENYPQALEHVVRAVNAELGIPIFITENGIATSDDKERISFIQQALQGVINCLRDGIPLIGYTYWSLLDNFEWQLGFSKTFGLIEVDLESKGRIPKESLKFLGSYKKVLVK